jgi:hypothetical protein
MITKDQWMRKTGAWKHPGSARKELIHEATNDKERYQSAPITGPRDDDEGRESHPWFEPTRKQKDELEYGVRHIANAAKYMAFQAEEASRRMDNLQIATDGWDDDVGTHHNGLSDALKHGEDLTKKMPRQIAQDIETLNEVGSSFGKLKVFGDDMDMDKHKYLSRPLDRTHPFKNPNEDLVEFYRGTDGKMYKKITVGNPIQLESGGTIPSGHVFDRICGGPEDFRSKAIEHLKWGSIDFQESGGFQFEEPITDDCGGTIVPVGETEDALLRVGKEIDAVARSCGVPQENKDGADDVLADHVDKDIADMAPAKYYDYLLANQPKRATLDKELELDPEVTDIPY